MKTNFKWIAAIPLSFYAGGAFAQIGLSIDDMNANIENCYKQTLLASQQTSLKKIQTIPCTRVINSHLSSKNNKSIALFNRSIVYMHKGEIKSALKDVQRAIKIAPDFYQAHVAAAQWLQQENSLNEALAHYERAISIDSSDITVEKNRDKLVEKVTSSQQILAMKREKSKFVKHQNR